MKTFHPIFLTILFILALTNSYAQHANHQKPADQLKRSPFYRKLGNREIYNLYVADTMVNYTGKTRPAMAVNGSIPAPTLTFTEGDTAEIYVHNTMQMETSIHWHGLLLPNRYDGVSNLTTSPLKPGETHLYKFPLVQHGTYWYHSHTMTQQQSGIYGAFIIRSKTPPVAKEYTLLLSEWTDANPEEVQRRLHNANDWDAIRKASVQSYQEAIKGGQLKTKIGNEWKRMTAMDVSDVAYDKIFINGKAKEQIKDLKPGDKLKLRVVNGGSSSYFWLSFGGGQITVVANDGEDVQPVKVERLLIAVAETYDIEVTIPQEGSYEFLATAEDRTKSASLWLGSGTRHLAKHLPKLNYFEGMKMMNGMMKMNGNLNIGAMKMANQTMDMNMVMYPELEGDSSSAPGLTLNYGMLKSTRKTTLAAGPTKVFRFELTGNMNRYVWSINNKTVSETDKIIIREGENLRIILSNNTMMRHPMHLHGHYFRLLNGKGEYAPLKNTLDVMPMETDTIEFRATASGDWFFHCHILYHMMSGMGRIFSYENSPVNPELPDPVKALKQVYADDKQFYTAVQGSLESNGTGGAASIANTRWKISTMWNVGLKGTKSYESETMVGRYFGQMQWLYGYAGFDYHHKSGAGPEKNLFGQLSNKNNRHTVVAGISYILPMLVTADARVDGDGKLRFQLAREDIAVSSRLRLALMGNTDKEYAAGLKYVIRRNISLSAQYDSDMAFGGGITFNY
jgi:FtsP/CotA-like multicopper oxidase with cupredoxin domain